MKQFDPQLLKNLYIPSANTHKGQNGKLLFIGGSRLFHAATIWPLTIASKIVDMVFYSSVPENNELIISVKKEFRDGMVIRRDDLEAYLKEADAILIGPGMVRTDEPFDKNEYEQASLQEINAIQDEGKQTYFLMKYLLAKFPEKKWIIDAGALQMIEPEWLKSLNGNVIITPHPKEFSRVFVTDATPDAIEKAAKEYNVILLVKGEKDIVCAPNDCIEIAGGNAGMTKGGTGDVLAGLIGALATKNDLYIAAVTGSYINKKAGDSLFQKVGYYFNATDLVNEIPVVMKELLLHD